MLAEVDGQNVAGSTVRPTAVRNVSFDFFFFVPTIERGIVSGLIASCCPGAFPGPGSVHPSGSGPLCAGRGALFAHVV